MDFDEETIRCLSGETFDSCFSLPFGRHREHPSVDRLQWLSDWVRGKRVVHVGCVDHVPLLKRKMERGEWLHGRLLRSAVSCLGVDVNAEGLRVLREEYGVTDLHCADLTVTGLREIRDEKFDILLVAEVLEHVDNPVDFLARIRERCSGLVAEFVVTVPNAFRLNALRDALRRRERINSDHRYWFTPYTLAKVLVRAGFRPLTFDFVDGFPRTGNRFLSWPRRRLLRRFPALRDTLIVTARPETRR